MSTNTGESYLVTENSEQYLFKPDGHSNHTESSQSMKDHQYLNKQMDEIKQSYSIFRQSLREHISDLQTHSLTKVIDEWERESINKVKQSAEQARRTLFKYMTDCITETEIQLNKIDNQMHQIQSDNEFIQTNIIYWKEELSRLKRELTHPPHIEVQQSATSLINEIVVNLKTIQPHKPNIRVNSKWSHSGLTVAGGNGKGNELNQLSYPRSIYIDNNQTIYVADYGNHRVVEWKSGATTGRIVAGGRGSGDRDDQLKFPSDVIIDEQQDSLIISDYGNRRVIQWPRQNATKGKTIISDIDCSALAMDKFGFLYVSNSQKHEVRRWKIGDSNGIVVAGGHGKGDLFHQLSFPTCIFVDKNQSVYVSDSGNNRVMKWMKGLNEGILVAGGQNQKKEPNQLSAPRGILTDTLGTVYVSDWSNGRVLRWLRGATEGTIVVGGNGEGQQDNQLSCPIGLCTDQYANLYVVDNSNHRIQKFNILPK